MIFLFFIGLIFGAPLAQYIFLDSTPYNYIIKGSYIYVITSKGLYEFYKNLTLKSIYESPVVITGKGIFEDNYILAPAGDRIVFFVPQGQGFRAITKPSPKYITSMLKHNDYYGFYEDGTKFYIYVFSKNYTKVLNSTTIKLSRDSKITYKLIPWGILLYTYKKQKLMNISVLNSYTIPVVPTGPITYNETHFFVPWYEHLYIFSKDNAFVEDIRMPNTVYGATFYDGQLYIHTFNQTWSENITREIDHPLWVDAKKVNNFWMIRSSNNTYLYKKFPQGKYEFYGDIYFYKPLNIFYVLDNNSLSAYRASGCFFNKRLYPVYCESVNITGDYIITKPEIYLDNISLLGDLRDGIEIKPDTLSGNHILRCVVNGRVGDSILVVRTSQGPLKPLNITVSEFSIREGELLNISVRDKGTPTNAIINIDGVEKPIRGDVSLNLTSGVHTIKISKSCYQTTSFEVTVRKSSSLGQYIPLFLGLIILAILSLLAYLKFIKKAI